MSVARPDRGYSWVIMLCCAYMHFALFGLFRSSGVIYFALLKEYNVTREEASWPFSLCPAVFQLVGPLVSVISYYLSQRLTCFIGCAIATVGVVACYFAESVRWITISYGVIHGVGFGMLVTLIPVILNQYFLKHRSTALGIAFSGGAVGSFVFPIVLEWLLDNYNLRGTFLLLGGVILNTMVASALLRPAPWLKKPKKESALVNCSEARDSGVCVYGDTPAAIKSSVTPIGSITFDSVFNDGDAKDIEDASNTVDSSELDTLNTEVKSDAQNEDDTLLSNNDSVLFSDSVGKVCIVANLDSSYKPDNNGTKKPYEVQQQEPLMNGSSVAVMPKKRRSKFSKAAHSIACIIKNPMFHLIYLSMFVYFLALQCFFTVIVDYAIDKGLSKMDGGYILSVFSIFDLCGRSGLGWVTDRKYVKRTHFLIFNFVSIGILLQLYPLVNDLTGTFAITAIHGVINGSCISIFFILLAEYLGMKRLTLVMGLVGFITGLLTLLRPFMIGLFRDTIGSYDWMFHCLGFLSFAFGLIWVVQTSLERRKGSYIQDATEKDFM